MTSTPSGAGPEPQTTTDEGVLDDRRFFGHPLALGPTFNVELWERFSFYGMQTVMAYYLYYAVAAGGLGLPEASATSVVGAYGGIVYLSSVAGAWVADRLLGTERTLFVSALTVMVGHIALAVLPGLIGVAAGLVLVALGSGGVKTAATSVIGTLYRRDDPRRDAGFSIFYMGINIGALVGPLLTGLAQVGLGFHYAFGLAAVGMAIGLGVYTAGRRTLPPSAAVVPDPLPVDRRLRATLVAVAVVVVVVLGFMTGVLEAATLSTAVAIVVAVAAAAVFALLLSSPKVDADERSRVRAFVPLWLGSVAFWSLFQQQFTVLTVYADQRVDRSLFGWEMPIPWINSMQPFFIVVLSPLFALLWVKLGVRAPGTPVKFALGAGGMGVAFLLFLPWAGGGANTTPVLAVALILLVFSLAELNLSPIGLSLSTRVGPAAFPNLTVALFYLSISLGSALSGTMAGFYSPETEGGYFGVVGGVAVVLGIVLALAAPAITKAMRGVR